MPRLNGPFTPLIDPRTVLLTIHGHDNPRTRLTRTDNPRLGNVRQTILIAHTAITGRVQTRRKGLWRGDINRDRPRNTRRIRRNIRRRNGVGLNALVQLRRHLRRPVPVRVHRGRILHTTNLQHNARTHLHRAVEGRRPHIRQSVAVAVPTVARRR